MTPDLHPTPRSNHPSTTEPTTHTKITDALLRALPSRRDIEILLDKVHKTAEYCCQSNFQIRRTSKETPKDHFPAPPNLLCPASHPVLLANQMIVFAAALQHIPPNQKIPGVTKHHHVIMQELTESAIKLVTTNDVLLGTLEGLENIILEAFYHIDSGNMRRSWITMRRAVMAGQLLGLHRPGHYRFKVINEKSNLDPEAMWASIVTMERVLSLLLGLPTSTGSPSSAILEAPRTSQETYNLPTLLSSMTARVLERNQVTVSQQALEMTQEIDRDIVMLTRNLPSEFWRPLALTGLDKDSVHAAQEIKRALSHMCYYTLVNQLHLPYMMSPYHASQRVYSSIACANASREILTREIALRTFRQNTAYSRMSDFQALIAGMTLMLAHAVGHCRKQESNPLAHQRPSDRATVERALECMKSMSELHKDVLAVKCARLLKDLLEIEAEAAEGKLQGTNSGGEDKHSMLIIVVPYIGAIGIGREGVKCLAPSEADQAHGPNEGVTIGGIGSMHLKSPRLPDHSTGDAGDDTAAKESPITRATDAPSTQLHATHAAIQGLSGDFTMQQDQMFPDAAATMDDWVLQGFDTAFFDILMREQLSDSAEA